MNTPVFTPLPYISVDPMNEELLFRINIFFDYWRERYAFIESLDFNKYSHEANVLLDVL